MQDVTEKKRPTIKDYFPMGTSVEAVHKEYTAAPHLYRYMQALDAYIDGLEKEQPNRITIIFNTNDSIEKSREIMETTLLKQGAKYASNKYSSPQTTKEGFVWTDELVKDFHESVVRLFSQGHSLGSALSVFKKSVQPRTPLFKTEDGVGIHIGEDFWYTTYKHEIYKDVCNSMTGGKIVAHQKLGDKFFSTKETAKAYVAKQSLSNTLKREQEEQIKIQKEFVAPEQEQPSKDRDWEIVSVIADDSKPIYYPSKEMIYLCIVHNGERIHSVRRLSDGEVFSVGDEVSVTCDDGKGFNDTINHFTFTSGVDIIDVYFKNQIHTAYSIHWLKIAKKLPSTKPVEQAKKKFKILGYSHDKRAYEGRKMGNVLELYYPYEPISYESNEFKKKLPLIIEAIENIINDN